MKDKFDLNSLVTELLAKTKEHRLKWQRSLPDSFTTAFGGRYTVDIIQLPGVKGEETEIQLVIQDDVDDSLIEVSDSEMENPAILHELFNIVLQRATRPELKIQDAVDQLRKL
jgi:hypothetical protein